jgi:hypothetical protein
MYKSEYTPNEAQEQFKLIDESLHHDAYKERAKRYIRNRTVEAQEVVDK